MITLNSRFLEKTTEQSARGNPSSAAAPLRGVPGPAPPAPTSGLRPLPLCGSSPSWAGVGLRLGVTMVGREPGPLGPMWRPEQRGRTVHQEGGAGRQSVEGRPDTPRRGGLPGGGQHAGLAELFYSRASFHPAPVDATGSAPLCWSPERCARTSPRKTTFLVGKQLAGLSPWLAALGPPSPSSGR